MPNIDIPMGDRKISELISDLQSETNQSISEHIQATALPLLADEGDTFADVTKRFELTDTPTANGSQINLEHYGNGTGPNAYNSQTFGLDIHNNVGAKTALVVHQYSNDGPAVRLDNTGTGVGLLIAQTNNPIRNPSSVEGTAATGDAIRVIDFAGNPWFRVLGRGEVVLNAPADANGLPLEIVGHAASTKKLFRMTMNNPQVGMEIAVNPSAAGAYPMLIAGQNYGPSFTTTTNGGQTLRAVKTGTGSGDVVYVSNSGTGASVSIRQGTTEIARLNADGEFEHLTVGKGILLRSPDGTRYRLSAANGGTLSVTAA
jgi:hypothetical protein